MSAALAPQLTGADPGAPAGDPRPIRTFLTRYVATLLPLLAGASLLLVAWAFLADRLPAGGPPWAGAAVAATAWACAVTGWLLRRGWRRGTVHAVAWAGPAAVLAMPAAAGWLPPDGLVLWAPTTSVLAVALAMAAGVGSDG
jgi:hypothetical protein